MEFGYQANVQKLPFKISAQKVDFKVLQPLETEVYILEVQNLTQSEHLVEIIPPELGLSGLRVTPSNQELSKEKVGKFGIQYHSDFRQITFENSNVV